MRSAYSEAQSLGYHLENIIDEEMNKAIREDPKDSTISKEFQAAYFYGMMTAFKQVKEIIKYETSKEMADLINDEHNFDAMLNELKELREKVKELENK